MITHFQDLNGNHIQLPVGKVICVGRNYHDHIVEMASVPSAKPLLFMKPSTALVDASKDIFIPQDRGECHNELEVAWLIGEILDRNTELNLSKHIYAVGLALDLTLRDVQSQCKQKGHPWERAKSFDGSCPISSFVNVPSSKLQDLHFELKVNGKTRQRGHTANMIFNTETLLNDIRQQFTLLPGDIVLTGTPKGVGPLYAGDSVEMCLHHFMSLTTQVQACN